MQNLLYFLYRFRTFGLFLLLEVICAWLIISYNNRPNAAFLNSSNALIASINSFTNTTSSYFNLQQVNQQLMEENLALREELTNLQQVSYRRRIPTLADSTLIIDSVVVNDTSIVTLKIPEIPIEERFNFFKAKVINNTFRRSMNYITIDMGLKDSIAPGMGVITSAGVVGQVKSVSNHFATITSLLHRDLLVSGAVKRTKTLCSAQWELEGPTEISIKFIPRHVPVKEGDTIITSGYNAVFPEGIMIGTIKSLNLAENDVFYDAKAELSVDFSSLSYVYIVRNNLRQEQDSLQTITLSQE